MYISIHYVHCNILCLLQYIIYYVYCNTLYIMCIAIHRVYYIYFHILCILHYIMYIRYIAIYIMYCNTHYVYCNTHNVLKYTSSQSDRQQVSLMTNGFLNCIQNSRLQTSMKASSRHKIVNTCSVPHDTLRSPLAQPSFFLWHYFYKIKRAVSCYLKYP
jgi:hypothetical protein